MITISKFPKGDVWLAVSGGVDSMTILKLVTLKKQRISGVVNIDHGTPYSELAGEFVRQECQRIGITCHTHEIGLSNEQGWRDQRKAIYRNYETIVTAHHLDDVVEWWLITSLRGNPKLMPFQSGNVHHPFLLSSKKEIMDWGLHHKVNWMDDPTNTGDHNTRAKIRGIMPQLLDIHPGLQSTIKKKLLRS